MIFSEHLQALEKRLSKIIKQSEGYSEVGYVSGLRRALEELYDIDDEILAEYDKGQVKQLERGVK